MNTWGNINYNEDGTVTHVAPKIIPETEPSGHLYSHYKKVQPPFSSPDINWIINAEGTEFDSLSIEHHLAAKNAHELLEIIRNYKHHDVYSLDKTAREIADIFRVDMDVFNSRHDRLAEIYAGNLQKCYTFSALRSFAWTLGKMADTSGRSIEDYSIDELLRIIDFVADEKWLNYDHTGTFKGLCDHPDSHVMYVPDELCTPERSAELRTILVQMPVVSLGAFRECLQTLHPAMLKLVDYLAEDRDHKEQLTGNAADVLYAWCSLCVAAKEPFISEDGPMVCAWRYPGDEHRYLEAQNAQSMQRLLEQQAQQKQERIRVNAQWLEAYNSYICKHPTVTIAGKKFVFTGLGVIKTNQKDQPIVQQVIAQGGLFRQSISGVTDYLVVGDDDPSETRIQEAIAQQRADKPIQIIRLKDLEDALEDRVHFYPDDPEDIDEDEENIGLAPEVLSSIQDSLNKLNETMESMQGAFDQYSDLRKKQDEDKQRREQELQSARENAVVDADNDEACMFVVLSIIDELNLTDKYGSSEAFFECYGEDFPAYDADSLWALRCKVHANRNNEAQQAAYIRCFMMLDVKKRFGWTVTVCVNISSVFDIAERINQAMELNARWFATGEASAVQTELQKLKEDFRESMHSQFSAICKDWLSWTTAKPLLFVEYSNLPSAYDENTLSCQVGAVVVTVRIRSAQNSMLVSQVLNWYAWYWGVTPKDVWLAAYKDRFDHQGQPLLEKYLDNETTCSSNANMLCRALDKLSIPYHKPIQQTSQTVSRPQSTTAAKANIPSESTASSSKKEGCYIATAVYGSYDAPEVLVLRRFRDETLQHTKLGRWFIRVYYKLSPSIAEKLRSAKKINGVVRKCLDRWVHHLESKS